MNDSRGPTAEQAAAQATVQAAAQATSLTPIWMVFGCTVIGACAQVLFKLGSMRLPTEWGPQAIPQLLLNVPLLGGLVLYGINTILMVLALRKGELSLLYPIISLTYLWVSAISFFVFHEPFNMLKVMGLVFIVGGVVVLGIGGRR